MSIVRGQALQVARRLQTHSRRHHPIGTAHLRSDPHAAGTDSWWKSSMLKYMPAVVNARHRARRWS